MAKKNNKMYGKSYGDFHDNIYDSGMVYADPDYFDNARTSDETPNKIVRELFNPIVIEQRRTLPLTDEQIDKGGANAALILRSRRDSPTIPTYKGGALLPEIGVTPKYNYIPDGINNHRWRRSLERYGGIVQMY